MQGKCEHMSEIPLFSILIANYNNGVYLQECFDSVLAQRYSHWEVVVVDDGSTDNSADVYATLQEDERVRVYVNEGNRGCGYTKRRLVELAKGEVCGFLDADDTLTPDALQVMVDAHVAHPECSLIYSQYYIADAELRVSGISQHQRQLPMGESFLDNPFSGAISHFVTFKKECYCRTMGIDEKFAQAVDIDLYLKLEEVGASLFVAQPLYTYRMYTGNNISLGDNAQMAQAWDVMARVKACERRGRDISAISKMVNTIYEIGHEQGRDEGILSVRKSKAYRIGKFILKPFKWASGLLVFHKKSVE